MFNYILFAITSILLDFALLYGWQHTLSKFKPRRATAKYVLIAACIVQIIFHFMWFPIFAELFGYKEEEASLFLYLYKHFWLCIIHTIMIIAYCFCSFDTLEREAFKCPLCGAWNDYKIEKLLSQGTYKTWETVIFSFTHYMNFFYLPFFISKSYSRI